MFRLRRWQWPLLAAITLAAVGCSSSSTRSGADTTIPNDTANDVMGQDATGNDGVGVDATSDDTGSAEDSSAEDSNAEDTQTEDTGATEDTAVEDTAVEDTAVEDTAVEDTAVEDSGAEDIGSIDDAADAVDTASDASATDVADTTADDTGDAADTGAEDTGAADTGAAEDTGAEDTGSPQDTADAADTGAQDTGAADTADAADTAADTTETTDTGSSNPCQTKPAGIVLCDDGNACTKDDACSGGTCVGGSDVNCDDGNGCTLDVCDKLQGCGHTPFVGACSDGDACTGPDACKDTACVAGAKLSCDDNKACTIDACDAKAGCMHTPAADGTSCGGTSTCAAGSCVAASNKLAEGALVITEIHVDPSAVTDAVGEWVEVYNPSDADVNLAGLVLRDKSTSYKIPTDAPVMLKAKQRATLGLNADSKVNGGVTHLAAYTKLALGNSSTGGLFRIENADASLVDQVAWQNTKAKEGWPGTLVGRSLQLAPDALDAKLNDVGSNWCVTTATFGGGDSGTPGKEGEACVVGWCRFQWNPKVVLAAGGTSTYYARVWAAGITDKSDATDVHPDLIGQLGYGVPLSLPWVDATWVWANLIANSGWDAKAANEPNNDEYQATLMAPTVGSYATAFRFFLRGSTRGVYCDQANGIGKDGAEDGYQVELAGQLTVTAATAP